jgi:Zn-dependent peptidase ImmA (M78 family)
MARTVRAQINPELLSWAREEAGLSLSAAAQKAQITASDLKEWEQAESQPSIAQLRKLANVYRRPLGVFFLDARPARFRVMHDFRRLPGPAQPVPSPELQFAIRRARDQREIALELFDALALTPAPFLMRAALNENPESVAARFRAQLGLTFEEQEGWRDERQAFAAWKAALEDAGALVLQAQKIDVEEMRGFSLSGEPLPVIVLNIKDAVAGRIFSALHELTHLALHEAGLCNLSEARAGTHNSKVEAFCNHVAGAILIPSQRLLDQPEIADRTEPAEWNEEQIQRWSRQFRVSREVVLRRLLLLGHVTRSFYLRKVEQYGEELKARPKPSGFAPPHQLALATAGRLFARLVLESYYKERITSSDVAGFLGLKLKHLPRIEQELQKTEADGMAA